MKFYNSIIEKDSYIESKIKASIRKYFIESSNLSNNEVIQKDIEEILTKIYSNLIFIAKKINYCKCISEINRYLNKENEAISLHLKTNNSYLNLNTNISNKKLITDMTDLTNIYKNKDTENKHNTCFRCKHDMKLETKSFLNGSINNLNLESNNCIIQKIFVDKGVDCNIDKVKANNVLLELRNFDIEISGKKDIKNRYEYEIDKSITFFSIDCKKKEEILMLERKENLEILKNVKDNNKQNYDKDYFMIETSSNSLDFIMRKNDYLKCKNKVSHQNNFKINNTKHIRNYEITSNEAFLRLNAIATKQEYEYTDLKINNSYFEIARNKNTLGSFKIYKQQQFFIPSLIKKIVDINNIDNYNFEINSIKHNILVRTNKQFTITNSNSKSNSKYSRNNKIKDNKYNDIYNERMLRKRDNRDDIRNLNLTDYDYRKTDNYTSLSHNKIKNEKEIKHTPIKNINNNKRLNRLKRFYKLLNFKDLIMQNICSRKTRSCEKSGFNSIYRLDSPKHNLFNISIKNNTILDINNKPSNLKPSIQYHNINKDYTINTNTNNVYSSLTNSNKEIGNNKLRNFYNTANNFINNKSHKTLSTSTIKPIKEDNTSKFSKSINNDNSYSNQFIELTENNNSSNIKMNTNNNLNRKTNTIYFSSDVNLNPVKSKSKSSLKNSSHNTSINNKQSSNKNIVNLHRVSTIKSNKILLNNYDLNNLRLPTIASDTNNNNNSSLINKDFEMLLRKQYTDSLILGTTNKANTNNANSHPNSNSPIRYNTNNSSNNCKEASSKQPSIINRTRNTNNSNSLSNKKTEHIEEVNSYDETYIKNIRNINDEDTNVSNLRKILENNELYEEIQIKENKSKQEVSSKKAVKDNNDKNKDKYDKSCKPLSKPHVNFDNKIKSVNNIKPFNSVKQVKYISKDKRNEDNNKPRTKVDYIHNNLIKIENKDSVIDPSDTLNKEKLISDIMSNHTKSNAASFSFNLSNIKDSLNKLNTKIDKLSSLPNQKKKSPDKKNIKPHLDNAEFNNKQLEFQMNAFNSLLKAKNTSNIKSTANTNINGFRSNNKNSNNTFNNISNTSRIKRNCFSTNLNNINNINNMDYNNNLNNANSSIISNINLNKNTIKSTQSRNSRSNLYSTLTSRNTEMIPNSISNKNIELINNKVITSFLSSNNPMCLDKDKVKPIHPFYLNMMNSELSKTIEYSSPNNNINCNLNDERQYKQKDNNYTERIIYSSLEMKKNTFRSNIGSNRESANNEPIHVFYDLKSFKKEAKNKQGLRNSVNFNNTSNNKKIIPN